MEARPGLTSISVTHPSTRRDENRAKALPLKLPRSKLFQRDRPVQIFF
jgi:hypothetical protein